MKYLTFLILCLASAVSAQPTTQPDLSPRELAAKVAALVGEASQVAVRIDAAVTTQEQRHNDEVRAKDAEAERLKSNLAVAVAERDALKTELAKLTKPAPATPGTLPAIITKSMNLERGKVYDVRGKAPKIEGDGITIGVTGDPALPLPLVKFSFRAFEVGGARNLTLEGFAAEGSLVEKELFVHLWQNGATLRNLSLGAMGSFIEQSKAVNDVLIEGCVQTGKFKRYAAYPRGKRWMIRGNKFLFGVDDESTLRSGYPDNEDMTFEGNDVFNDHKSAIEIRKGNRIVAKGNTFGPYPISMGGVEDERPKSPGVTGDFTAIGNIARDPDHPSCIVKLHHAAGHVVIADNQARVELSDPHDWCEYKSVSVKSDRDVKVYGQLSARFGKYDIDAPGVVVGTKRLAGRQTK